MDDAGARYPLTIDPIIEDARLTASDGAAGDLFGNSVALDGDTVVVGAFADDIGANTDQGSAYVFVRPAGGWAGALAENAKLIASAGEANKLFGLSVAVSGDTVVVGAEFDDVGNNIGQGSAYVFVKPSGGWAGLRTEDAKLTASDGRPVDFFGESVAVSGDSVVVRALANDVGENPNQGAAYVFVRPAGGWAGLLHENAKLVASDGATNDFLIATLGRSVTVSGDTVVVGAAGDDVGTNTDQGSAYVFVKPVGGWAGLLQENAKLSASDGAADNRFGFSVGASGDTVVVGTFFATSRPAYVFVEPPGGWAGALHENARLTSSDGVSGSLSVAASGDTVVFPPNVYFKPAGGWAGVLTENGRLTRSDGAIAFFGPVDLDGNTAVGGFCGDTAQGSACVFEGLQTDTFEAEPAATRTDCKTAGCTIPITCNLSQNCINRIRLLVRARDIRLNEEARAKAPRMIRIASAVANIPPSETRPVRLKFTKRGRNIFENNKRRRLKGVIQISNSPGTAFETTSITIRLR